MEGYTFVEKEFLRNGYTTGACACGASKAAAIMALIGKQLHQVTISLPEQDLVGVIKLTLKIIHPVWDEEGVYCSVIKDGGDDPDVTDGITITAKVVKIPERQIIIDGGKGIGRVTRPGLKCNVGEAAINPGPREMIRKELEEVCHYYQYHGGFSITIMAENGEEIAKQTMNPRLGIKGGVSILGTTGIVKPMSQKALIDTIRTEIDMRKANNASQIIITPGNYGREFARNTLGLNLYHSVMCSNYIGETLDYMVYCGIENIFLIGHAGKLVKLAAGIFNTHSKVADARMEIMAAHSAMAGATPEQTTIIMNCITTDEAYEYLKKWAMHKQVWRSIGDNIQFHLYERVKGQAEISFTVFSQIYGVLYSSKKKA